MLLAALLFAVIPQADAPAPDAPAAPLEVRLDEAGHQRYLLHAPPPDAKVPARGRPLLLVLPGGDGGADFAPFVGRIRAHALSDEWIVAQVVAPAWNPEQAEANVWPTRLNPAAGAEVESEAIVAGVLADVKRRQEVDAKRVYTLAWSSSGTLAYTLALDEKLKIRGTLVAMSVYKPELLPSLRAARGKAFYLLHSPEDFIPIAMAERARDELSDEGAKVELATYAGGHGWHGDVYGMLRAGVAFLEREAR